MRVLAVSTFPARREGNGAEIQLFNLLRALRAADASLEVRLIAPALCPDVEGVEVTVVPRRPVPRLVGRVTGAATGLLRGEPALVRQVRLSGVADAARRMAAAWTPDVVHVTDTSGAFVGDALGDVPRIMVCLDAWHVHAFEDINDASGGLRLLRRLTAGTIERYERAMIGRYDATVVVSERDRLALAGLDPAARLEVIPNGVDTERFAPPDGAVARPGLLAFHGALDYPTNIDAAHFLVRDILPLVRAQEPGARVRLIGRDPAPSVQALAGGPVEVTGEVADMAAALAQAEVGIYPIRRGSGIKNKILEAAASGLAVVTTPFGLGDIDLRPDDEVALAEGAPALATAVVRLLRAPEQRRAMASAARSRMVRSWGWEVPARRFAALYSEVAARPHHRA